MPASKQQKILVGCPHCGHLQEEPRAAISTVCKKCYRNFRVQETLNPAPKPAEIVPARKRIKCFDCGGEMEVALNAQSSMCKWCSRYIDLQDYTISNAVSKNFKTIGAFTLAPGAYVFNSEAIVGEAAIKGRFHGKLVVDRSLVIYSTAQIKGSFTAGKLVIPPANSFRWHEAIRAVSAEIAGELVANLQVNGQVVLKSTARMFGDIQAADLAVEEGAVVAGNLRIGPKN